MPLPNFRHHLRTAGLAALTGVAALAGAASPLAAQQPAAAPRQLSLEEALGMVAQRSEAVRIAAAGLDRAAAQLRQTRANLLPQLSGVANYQRTIQSQFQSIAKSTAGSGGGTGGDGGAPADSGSNDLANNPISAIFASENTVTLGLQFSQTIFTGGRLMALTRASRQAEEAARIGVTSATAQARLDVTQMYYDALLADRLVAIAESSLVQTERTLRQTRVARQVGSTAEFDLLRARVTRDNQLPLVIQARTQRTTAYLRLRQLLEIPATQPLTLTTGLEEGAGAIAAAVLPAAPDTARLVGRVDAPVDVDALLAEHAAGTEFVAAAVAAADTAAEARAPVRQATRAMAAQQALLAAQRAQRLPSISLSSNYQRFAYPITGLPGLNEFYPNWTVSVGLQLPIFTGGRISGQIQEAQAGLAESRAQLQQAEELAALDAQLAVAQLRQAAAAYAASTGTADQAARAYQIAEVRFREGISTQVELDDSRLLLEQSLANRAQAARDLQVALTRLQLLPDLPLGGSQGASQAGGSTGAAGGAPSGASRQGGAAAQGTSAAGAGGTMTGTSGGITP